jgi:ACR3 family arsenite transporter
MCCSAGVCGPEFDPKLARLAGVTLLINWAVKPFSMAALGRLLIGHPFRPYLPAEQIDAHIAGLTILAAAPCTAMVFA